jgi:hypothetical protein
MVNPPSVAAAYAEGRFPQGVRAEDGHDRGIGADLAFVGAFLRRVFP